MEKNEITLSGNFNVEISDDKTEAFLVFSSGTSDDKLWSIADIASLFQNASISGIKIDDIAKQIDQHQQKKEKQFRFLAAHGSAPVSPVAETFQAIELSVPENLKDAIGKTLAHASGPSIFRELQIKVEKEKTVIKKGALPFLHGKEEKVLVTQKESRQDRVYVDPKVLSWGFVQSGNKIGMIFAPRLGVPGKTVTGGMVVPPVLDDLYFYPGDHVSRKGNDINAVVTGIARIGHNWIDVIPFSEHSWTLSQSNDKATCFLDFTPGSEFLPLPNGQEILDAAVKLGYKAEELPDGASIQNLIDISSEAKIPLVQKSLSLDQDAFIDIVVSDDKLKAVLNVTKGSGQGRPLLLNDLGKVINQSGLSFSKEQIKKDIPVWFNGPEKALIGYVLASGKPSQAPPAQSTNYSAEFLSGKEYTEILSQIANFPLQDLDSFPRELITGVAWIEKDQRVLTLGPIVSGSAGKDVYGEVISGTPSEAFQLQIYGFLEQIGPTLIVAKKTGLMLKAEKDKKTYLAAFEHLDGEIQIEVADANMSAWIVLNAHRGTGKALKRADIITAIEKAGVKKGIESETLERIIEASESSRDIERICFARGQAPQPGSPGEIRYLIQFASGSGVSLRADGTADFKNQDKMTTVKKGSVIAEILPSRLSSIAGWDVLGKELPAPTNAVMPVEIGAHILHQKEEDGRSLLIAELDGELLTGKGKVEIVASHTIKGNVDAVSGNIKFPGTVQITGDVMSGFYVMAGGEIKIGGNVEGALLSADQDLIIQNGVKGAGKALLRTKKDILAGFVEQATLLAVGDIKIKKALLRSRVKCNGSLFMADDAKIIGGQIKVKQGLVVGELGNAAGVATHVFFGQDILVEDQIEVEEKEISKVQEDLVKLSTAMRSSEKLNDKLKLQEMFNEKVRLMKVMEKRNLRLFTLKERFEQHFDSALVVKGTIFPGVVIESHGRTHEFQKPSKAVRIRFDTSTGRIVEEPLGQKV